MSFQPGDFPTFKLNNGTQIPIVGYGLGTANYKSKPGDLDEDTISYTQSSLKLGLYHQDGAEMYGNEEELGEALKRSGVPRSQIFLTTKLLSMDKPTEAFHNSLEKLKTDYVDLYLIHIPFESENDLRKEGRLEECWLEIEKLYKKGLAKAIGVSNFTVPDLERVLKVGSVVPAVNQMEYNPYCQSPVVRRLHQKHDILTTAYSPLTPITRCSGGPLDPIIERLTKKYNKTNTQILLSWAIQNGAVAITTSKKESRMKEAYDVAMGGWKLDEEDVKEITEVGGKHFKRAMWTKQFKPQDEKEGYYDGSGL